MDAHRAREIAARWSVGVGVVILGCKLTAWLSTGSLAIMSDALESVVHVGATIVMYVALRLARLPPDRSHPFGHGKVGAFSIGFEGGLVAASGALVLWMVVMRLVGEHKPENLGLGAAWTAGAAVVNTVLGIYLLRTGKRTDSRILIADAHHVLADVWTSVAAIVGVVLVILTDIIWFDYAVAVIAGVHLLMVGGRLVKEAGSELMDAADPDVLERVVAVVNRYREPEWLDLHRLRVLKVGERRYVEFHLVVPGGWTVARAHDVMEHLEEAILAELDAEGAVNVHLDFPEVELSEDLSPREAFTIEAATRLRMSDKPGPWVPASEPGSARYEALREAELNGGASP